MIKVSVMYPNVPGVRFDHEYYRDKHMPLVKVRMGDRCKYYTVDKGIAGGLPEHRLLTSECAISIATRSKRFKPASALMRRRSWRTFRTIPINLR